MMNFSLAREIYGTTPWMVDPISFSSHIKILQDIRAGLQLTNNDSEKLNTLYVLDPKSNTQITFDEFQLKKTDPDAEVVSVVKLNGPIVKNSGASSLGMKELSQQVDRMTDDKRVKGHIIDTDSGGGSSDAVLFMADSIKRSQAAGKPVVQFIEKGGLNASAAYYIGSFSNYIIAETENNLVGSIGTMIQFEGFKQQHTEENGLVHVRAYATASVEKNLEFEEAIKGNLEPITSNILDPANNLFMGHIENNRANVLPRHLSGKIFRAKDVVGTLIDSIGNMDSAVNKVLELSNKITTNTTTPAGEPTKTTNNITNSTMTTQEIRQQHPDAYNSIYSAGVKNGEIQAQDRTGAWLAHLQTDPVAVKAGIISGEEITATQREEFMVKAGNQAVMANLRADNADPLKPGESTTGEEEEPTEADSFYAKIDTRLKPSKN